MTLDVEAVSRRRVKFCRFVVVVNIHMRKLFTFTRRSMSPLLPLPLLQWARSAEIRRPQSVSGCHFGRERKRE